MIAGTRGGLTKGLNVMVSAVLGRAVSWQWSGPRERRPDWVPGAAARTVTLVRPAAAPFTSPASSAATRWSASQ